MTGKFDHAFKLEWILVLTIKGLNIQTIYNMMFYCITNALQNYIEYLHSHLISPNDRN